MLKDNKFLHVFTKGILIFSLGLLFLLNNNSISLAQDIDESLYNAESYDLRSMMDDAQKNIEMLEQQLTKKQLRERALEAYRHFDLGNSYYQQGRIHEALSEWRIAIVLAESSGLEDYLRGIKQKIKAIERQKALMEEEARKNALLKQKLEEEMVLQRQTKTLPKIGSRPKEAKEKKEGFIAKQIQAQDKQAKTSVEAGIAGELKRKKKEAKIQQPEAKEAGEIKDEDFKKQIEASINKGLQKKVAQLEEDKQKLKEEKENQLRQAKAERSEKLKKEQQERLLQNELIELEKEQQRLKQEREKQESQAKLKQAEKLKQQQQQQQKLLQDKLEKEKAEKLERQKEQETKKAKQEPAKILPLPQIEEAKRITEIEKALRDKEKKVESQEEKRQAQEKKEEQSKQAQEKKEELKKKEQEALQQKKLQEEQKTKEGLLKAQQEKKLLFKKRAKLLEDREKTRQRLARVSRGYADLEQKEKDRLHLLVINKLLDKIQQELNKYK